MGNPFLVRCTCGVAMMPVIKYGDWEETSFYDDGKSIHRPANFPCYVKDYEQKEPPMPQQQTPLARMQEMKVHMVNLLEAYDMPLVDDVHYEFLKGQIAALEWAIKILGE